MENLLDITTEKEFKNSTVIQWVYLQQKNEIEYLSMTIHFCDSLKITRTKGKMFDMSPKGDHRVIHAMYMFKRLPQAEIEEYKKEGYEIINTKKGLIIIQKEPRVLKYPLAETAIEGQDENLIIRSECVITGGKFGKEKIIRNYLKKVIEDHYKIPKFLNVVMKKIKGL